MNAYLGIDPGAVETGMVLREGSNVLGYRLLRLPDYKNHPGPWQNPFGAYLVDIVQHVTMFIELATAKDYAVKIRCEGVNKPNPHVGNKDGPRFIDPMPLVDTGQVIGAIRARYPETLIVAPGGNGSNPLMTYPSILVGKRETKGTGRKRHLRSAWDVSYSTMLDAI